jgi:ribonuclease HI
VLFFANLADAESAELRARKQGLSGALEKNLRRVVLEMDSSGVVAKQNRDEPDWSTHGPLVEEIKSLLRKFNDSLVRSVR